MRLKRLLKDDPKEQSGINMVDLMMWLVIAALLLAAAIQGINYYQRTAWAHQAKSDLTGSHSWALGQVSLTSDVPTSFDMQQALNDGSLKLSGTGPSHNIGMIATSGESKYCIGVQAPTLSGSNIFYSSSDAPSNIKVAASLPAECGTAGEPAATGRETITWKPSASLGIGTWDVAVTSANGSQVFAAKRNGSGFYSDDSGSSWNETPISYPGGSYITDGVMSDDGTKVILTKTNDKIHKSVDGGKTFTTHSNMPYSYDNIDASSDIAVQVATRHTTTGQMLISSNSGDTWSNPGVMPTNAAIRDVAVSGNGNKIFAVTLANNIVYVSENRGASWTQRGTPGSAGLVSIDASADGKYLVVLQGNGTGTTRAMYTSSDSGATWQTAKLPIANLTTSWMDVAVSADGSRMIAAKYGSPLVTSSDFGTTWESRSNAGTSDWMSLDTSNDGRKIVAGRSGSSLYVGSY